MSQNYKIAIIHGDGIGGEIVSAAQAVLEAIAVKYNVEFAYTRCLMGGESIDAHGVPITDEAIEICKQSDAVLMGAVGGPKWDNVAADLRPERGLLKLRKSLGLYANLRPIRIFDSLIEFSPLKPQNIQNVNFMIVRELTGGIYFGDKKEAYMDGGIEKACDVESYSRPEIERIMSMAVQIAKVRNNHVTSVEKSNVLASSRLWKKIELEYASKEPSVSFDHLYVDNCAMQLVLNPKRFDVLVTNNIFGDILSDEAAVVAGSIGMLPSASLGDGTAVYEPIHGSAPDIAGKDIANPMGTILSAAMMLKYSLNMHAAAEDIENAVNRFLKDGYRTSDLYQEGMKKVGTKAAGEKIVEYIKN